jgi:putative NADPH-quinone reductase
MNVLLIQGHPDPADSHFGNALADAYAQAAENAGHAVRRVDVAQLDFPLVRTREDWREGEPPTAIASAQADVSGPIISSSSIHCGWAPCRRC